MASKAAAKPVAAKKTPAPAKAVAAPKKVAAKKTAASKPAPQAAATRKTAAPKAADAKAKAAGSKTAAPAKAAPPAKPVASKPAAAPARPALAASPAAMSQPAATTAGSETPARSSKAAARLAQLTVPSMAQATASTAAKASYVPTMSQTLIAPPLPTAIKKDPKLANNWKTKPGEQLTDEELLAMPDSEYMNDKQLAAFRVRLLRLKQDILNNAGETTEHLREDTVIVPDPADRATIEEEHALELRTRDRERKLLKKIEQALARIDAGDYGYCDETGEPIGVARLLARPTATLSLEAQQRRELKQKMFGD
ncbi:MAG: RNA polymerase-binding protein DksA [Hylemonella sp.]